jgi:hypothetical protein
MVMKVVRRKLHRGFGIILLIGRWQEMPPLQPFQTLSIEFRRQKGFLPSGMCSHADNHGDLLRPVFTHMYKKQTTDTNPGRQAWQLQFHCWLLSLASGRFLEAYTVLYMCTCVSFHIDRAGHSYLKVLRCYF